jgi:hypothetical protein
MLDNLSKNSAKSYKYLLYNGWSSYVILKVLESR